MTAADRAPFAERLANARKVLAFLEGHVDELRAEIDVARADQIAAAQMEAYRLWNGIGETLHRIEPGRWRPSDAVDAPPAVAHFLAAGMGCMQCVHLRRGAAPGVVIVDLNHRLALCPRCARTFRVPIDDRRCEVCDETVADNRFTEFSVRVGPTLFVGNLGTSCCGWLLEGRAA